MARLTETEWNIITEEIMLRGRGLIPVLSMHYNVSVQSINAQLRKRGLRAREIRSDKGSDFCCGRGTRDYSLRYYCSR